MDTIAKAENVAMALGLSSLYEQKISILYVFGKAQYEVLILFKVTLCSSC
jgi:hypothetical protein